jgi:hypothetical protein
MGRACSTNWEKRNASRLFLENPEGKILLGRPRYGWVDSIKLDLGEIGRGVGDWTGLAQMWINVELL